MFEQFRKIAGRATKALTFKNVVFSYEPGYFHPVYFNVNGRNVLCMYRPAKDPIALLGIGHGFNSQPTDFDEETTDLGLPSFYDTLCEKGISVITTAFEHTHPKDRMFLQRFQEDTQAFFFDKNSPLFQVGPRDLPRHLLAHSARGLTTLNALLDKKNADFARQHFEALHIMNPMLGIAGVARNWTIKAVYNLFASLYPDNLPGTTHIDKFYMRRNNIKIEDSLPTHSQILAMNDTGQALCEKLKAANLQEILGEIDIQFIIGEDDNKTCPEINEEIGTLLKARINKFSGNHTPLTKDPAALDAFIAYIKRSSITALPASTAKRSGSDHDDDTDIAAAVALMG